MLFERMVKATFNAAISAATQAATAVGTGRTIATSFARQISQAVATKSEEVIRAALLKSVGHALAVSGFEFEEFRRGEAKVGLWRKSLNKDVKRPRRLMVLPGFGDAAASWWATLSPLMPGLKKHFDEIVFLEYPGFQGRLREDPAIDSMDLLIEITSDALDAVRPHTVFGHSLGGWLTAHWATVWGEGKRTPIAGKYQGAKRVILASPAGVSAGEDDLAAWGARFEKAHQGDVQGFKAHLFHKEPLWFRMFPRSLEDFFSQKEVLGFMRSIRDHHFLDARVSAIKSDVTLVWGASDDLNFTSWHDLWFGMLSSRESAKTERYTIPKVGHVFHIENPVRAMWMFRKILFPKRTRT